MREIKQLFTCKQILQENNIPIDNKCPFHDDNKESFSIFNTKEGYEMYKCHAECEKSQGSGDSIKLLSIIKGISYNEAYKELESRIKNKPIHNDNYKIYSYYNKKIQEVIRYKKPSTKDGNLHPFYCRLATKEEIKQGHAKNSPQRKVFDIVKEKNLAWVACDVDFRKVMPYGYERIIHIKNKQFFFLTEGEKDADSILKLDYKATNGISGASNNIGAKEIELIRQAKPESVVICMDYDKAGFKYAKKTYQTLKENSIRNIFILTLPYNFTEKNGKDISDFIQEKKIKKIDFINHILTNIEKITKKTLTKLISKYNHDTNAIKENYFEFTDYGNALRYAFHFGENIKYSPLNMKWYFYNGYKWEEDALQKHKRAYKNFLNLIKEDKYHSEEDKENWHKYCQKANSVSSLFKLLQNTLIFDNSVFDKKRKVVNTPTNTLVFNLSKLIVKENDKQDLITQATNVSYSKHSTCPTWEESLNLYFDGNKNKIECLQVYLGYSMLAYTNEKKLMIIQGDSDTGKSTILNVIGAVMEDYFIKVDFKLIGKFSETIRNEYESDIIKKRLVRISELPYDNVPLNEGKLKDYTGDIDTYTIRRIYQQAKIDKFYSKFIIDTNCLPLIKDDNLWGRIILLKLKNPITNKDLRIKTKLLEESEGILNWIIEGTKKYLYKYKKLFIPEEVKEDKLEWQEESDIISNFSDERIKQVENSKVTRKDLYKHYTLYCNEINQQPLTRILFIKNFNKRNNTIQASNGKERYYLHIKLI